LGSITSPVIQIGLFWHDQHNRPAAMEVSLAMLTMRAG
jgi:hypothetical protein